MLHSTFICLNQITSQKIGCRTLQILCISVICCPINTYHIIYAYIGIEAGDCNLDTGSSKRNPFYRKSFRTITLISFVPKIMEKVLDNYIRTNLLSSMPTCLRKMINPNCPVSPDVL